MVESAPELPSGKPDFKVQSSTSGSFYVEVTCALGDNVHSENERNRGRVFELIDTIESFNFRVGLTIRGEVPARFNKKMIRDQVHTWLRTLDYQEMVRRKASEQITMEVEKKVISIGNGSIELTLIVIDPPRSSREHGFVMFGPTGEMQLVITDKYIRNKVKAKARQLKGSDLPSLVVVNVLEPFMDDDDILSAFFGDLEGTVPMGSATSQPMRVQRSMKGAWIHNGRPQNRSVDAVLLLKNVGHDCIPSEEPKLVMNPFAEKDRIPMDIPFCRYFVPTPEGLRLTEITIKVSSVERTRDAWRDHWPLP